MNPLKVKARFGPLPQSLQVLVGDEGVDITKGLRAIRITQEGGVNHSFPTLVLEPSVIMLEVDGDMEAEVYMTEPAKDALRALGWLPPDEATPLMERAAQVLEAAYAFVDRPDDEDAYRDSYNALGAAVERHRTLSKEMLG